MLKTEVIKTTPDGTLLHDASRPFAVLFIQGQGKSRKVINRFSTKKAANQCAARFLARVIELG